MECGPCFTNLRPASFRGVTFHVQTDGGNYGRRIVMHEYPMRDTPFAEDLGRKAEKWKVKGYVVGEDAEARKNAVVAAARTRGTALLQLPAEPSRLVVCSTLSVSRNKDQCGIFDLEFEFEEAGAGPGFFPVSIFPALIGVTLTSAVQAFTDLYAASFRGYDVLPYVQDRAVQRVQTFASDVVSIVESTPVSDNDRAAIVVRDATDMYRYAQDYVRPGPGDPAETDVVAAVAALIDTLGTILVVDDAMPAMKSLAQFSVLENDSVTLPTMTQPLVTASSKPYSVSDLADAKNAAAFNGVVRSFALMGYARAVSSFTFVERSSAIQARADIVELFSRQTNATTDDVALNAVVAARGLRCEIGDETDDRHCARHHGRSSAIHAFALLGVQAL